MSTTADIGAPAARPSRRRDIGLRRRRAAETRFKLYGLFAIILAIAALGTLLTSIVRNGASAFQQTSVQLSFEMSPEIYDPNDLRFSDDPQTVRDALLRGNGSLSGAHFRAAVRAAISEAAGVDPDSDDGRTAYRLVSAGAWTDLRQRVLDDPSVIGSTQTMWLLIDGNADSLLKGWIDPSTPEQRRPSNLTDRALEMLADLQAAEVVQLRFNTGLFLNTTATRSAEAGLAVAVIGSLQMMLIVLALALPIGVAASIYLEEFAPKNRFTDFIEVNINNLAAVPSIVFGILGLAVFIQFAGLPRSAPIVGGLVLSLMTLPTIIIATRASLRAVPPSIRQAALGVGASKMQSVFHHVLPLALPGILTGTIIGIAQALGETAPLLIIGMDASVYDYPSSPLDPATSLPSQIYAWSKEATRGFVERTSAGIIVLLVVMALLNLAAVLLRRRFERRW